MGNTANILHYLVLLTVLDLALAVAALGGVDKEGEDLLHLPVALLVAPLLCKRRSLHVASPSCSDGLQWVRVQWRLL